ncbi:hypothetical protein PoB_003028400 [Plakobranchus ocellatus]|uniref:Uncharacterized protein n=1 Tax=Plakobranchus ocellatus TaxID=259542 RepID=A0AAV4AC09_9GAST|nr:hypothetical protein PoB_003028400 [Plakobranchus ocellatus]
MRIVRLKTVAGYGMSDFSLQMKMTPNKRKSRILYTQKKHHSPKTLRVKVSNSVFESKVLYARPLTVVHQQLRVVFLPEMTAVR